MAGVVAVYGSLRAGLHNHRVLGDSPYIDNGTIKGFSLHSLGAFPGIMPVDKPITDVMVELYQVDGDAFKRLDGLEGYPTFYNRKVVKVVKSDGEQVNAWVYYIDDLSDEPLVECGDWKKYLEDK